MSKFLFHLKFSEKENYVHEHELYEVMRSRNLYQVQFEVRSGFKKRMRNIEISQKAHVNGFQNNRNIFIHKMKERMEQAEQTKKKTTRLAEKSFSKLFPKDNKVIRRYTADFPNLIEKLATPVEPPLQEISPTLSGMRSRRGTGRTRRSSSTFLSNAPESPSMAATIYVESPIAELEKEKERNRNKTFMTSKIIVAGKTEPVTHYKEKIEEDGERTEVTRSRNSSIDKAFTQFDELDMKTNIEMGHEELNIKETGNKLPKLSNTKVGSSNTGSKTQNMPFLDSIFQSEEAKTDNQASSFLHFPDHLTTTENLDSETASQKVVEWATAHKLLSKSDKETEEEKTFKRLLIDRPSKWAYSHIHGPAVIESGMFDTQNINFKSNAERRKSRVVDFITEKPKPKATLSLPAIDSVRRKPLVCMEPGGLTPDGRLILTQGDYDEYLSGYRRARNMRLNLSKKKFKTLSKRVDKFHLSPNQQLKDETRIFTVQSEC